MLVQNILYTVLLNFESTTNPNINLSFSDIHTPTWNHLFTVSTNITMTAIKNTCCMCWELSAIVQRLNFNENLDVPVLWFYYQTKVMGVAVREDRSVLIRLQLHCRELTWTHSVPFNLCLPPIKRCVDLVIFVQDPRVIGSRDAQGALHARKRRNKQLQLWMDASPLCLLCIQWKHAARLAGRRGISL